MQKPSIKIFGRVCFALVLLAITLIIHSCHKDHAATDGQIATIHIEKFKVEYNKGIRPSLNMLDAQPGQAVLNLIHGLNVDWNKYSIIQRPDSSTVNEFEMMPDSAFFTPEHLNPGDTIKYNNKTSVVFIESAKADLNFFMKIIEDMHAPGTKKPLINDVHYGKIPAGFNGKIYYYTLDRKYLNGYNITNGHVTGTISVMPKKSSQELQVQNKDKKKVNSFVTCVDSDIYYSWCGMNGYINLSGDMVWAYLPCEDTYVGTVTTCYELGGRDGAPVHNDNGGGGGGGNGPTPTLEDSFNLNDVYIKNGKKPLAESPDRCSGAANLWSVATANTQEAVGVLTTDGKMLTVDLLPILGGSWGGLYSFQGNTYYTYPDSQGAPSQTYTGMLHAAGQYFIPIVATIHTHNECLSDGTDGISTQTQSTGDAALASSYSSINHYVIGCGKVGNFTNSNNNYNVLGTGALSTTCSFIH